MKKKVVLGMSGGVDSSVAALLLQEQGYEVAGYFMNCGVGGGRWPTSINWREDEKILRKVCRKLGIRLSVADCEIGYEKKIIAPLFRDYERGLTPNPDTLCNNVGKFPHLIKKANEIGADFIATGHYALVRDEKLYCGRDKMKDQSYFICGLNKKILKRCLFPLGDLTKREVREIAKKNGFDNFDKRSSRGICYLGKIDMKKFLRERIKEKKGDIVNSNGEVIGEHPGIMFFTIGEKIGEGKGTTLNRIGRKKYSRKKLFVAEKERGNKLVVAVSGSVELKTGDVKLVKFKLIDKNEKVNNKRFNGRIRHLGKFHAGKLKKKAGWIFIFDKGVEGVAPGQILVLYDGQRVVGCGEMR
ncbi:MAG: tRNA 2-thiouridine(34) synthase MnmA [archaeon]